MGILARIVQDAIDKKNWDALVFHLDRMSTTEIGYLRRNDISNKRAQVIADRILHMRSHNVSKCLDGRYRGRV